MKKFNRLFWLEVTAHNELEKLAAIIDSGVCKVDMQGECITPAKAEMRYKHIDFWWRQGSMHDRLEHVFVTVNKRIAS